MVTSLEEIQQIHDLFQEIRSQLVEQGYDVARDVPVGSMIEVPSALLTLDHIVGAVNFVSVGTNDLVQYLLAVDRDNAWVSSLYDPQHPAVIRALNHVAETSRSRGCRCSVCGDLAGDPAMAILLLGMGYDSVSVAPQFLPEIKYAVRRTSVESAQGFAQEALAEETSEGVRGVLGRIRETLYAE
jgi:phosphoenolpyruvate-protein kinase (PTS system EI component)